jgi:hypothetical protein
VHDILLPCNVVQGQRNDFAAPQTVHGEQQQDGLVTNVLRVARRSG